MTQNNHLWERNDIQFPRLLAEILATQDLDLNALMESMDLEHGDLMNLFDRAEQKWIDIKFSIGDML